MVARESVRARMASEHGISYTEFSYMLLQANDYLWLHEHEGVELQIGGSDQWGNLLAGVDLIRRSSGAAVHALAWPLITAPDGTKLGKTTGARIWLDPHRTSPYQLFQHWMATDDRQVRQFLAQFTLLPVTEIDEVVAAHEAAPERREAQRTAGPGGHGADPRSRVRRRLRRRRPVRCSAARSRPSPPGGSRRCCGRSRPPGPPPAELDQGLDVVEAAPPHPAGPLHQRGPADGGPGRGLRQRGAGRRKAAGLARSDLLHGRAILLRSGKRNHAALVVEG